MQTKRSGSKKKFGEKKCTQIPQNKKKDKSKKEQNIKRLDDCMID